MNNYYQAAVEETSIKIEHPTIRISLGWNPLGGSLGKVIKGIAEELIDGVSANAFDLNLGAIIRHSDESKEEMVFFGNKLDKSESIKYHFDNRTGSKPGEDERITINLHKLPASVSEIVLFTLIYDGANSNQSFGDIDDMFVQIKDEEIDKVLYRDDSSFKDGEAASHSAYVFGHFTKEDKRWTFTSMHRFSDENAELDLQKALSE